MIDLPINPIEEFSPSDIDPKKSVAGIAIRDGKIFIAQRIPGGSLGECWEFPGGKVEGNESDEDALIREFQEEFGINISVGKHLASAEFEHKNISRKLNAYEVFFNSENFVLCEHTSWRWASIDEIEQCNFADSDRKLIPAIKKYVSQEWFNDIDFWNEFAPVMFDEARWAEVPAVADGIIAFSGLENTLKNGGKIADLCCGMGRISNELARRGFSVTGIDITKSYLDAAREDAEAEGLSVKYIHQDVRTFRKPNSFDLALNLYISFGYFDKPEDDLLFIKNTFDSLKNGGVFIIELLGKEIAARDFIEGEAFDRAGFVVATEYKILGNWEQLQNTWTISNEETKAQKVFTQRLYAATELEAMLLQTGFSAVTIYGGWDGIPYDENARMLILAAKK
jgi:mutator protein MutT